MKSPAGWAGCRPGSTWLGGSSEQRDSRRGPDDGSKAEPDGSVHARGVGTARALMLEGTAREGDAGRREKRCGPRRAERACRAGRSRVRLRAASWSLACPSRRARGIKIGASLGSAPREDARAEVLIVRGLGTPRGLLLERWHASRCSSFEPWMPVETLSVRQPRWRQAERSAGSTGSARAGRWARSSTRSRRARRRRRARRSGSA